MASAAGASSQGALNFLSSLADREAIAFGEAIPTPMRMKFADYRKFNELQESPARRARDEQVERSRELLRQTVARMRGETGPDRGAGAGGGSPQRLNRSRPKAL